LHSWKEIAAYFDRGVRTVQRWQRKLQLPVHNSGPHSPVFAYRAELDYWLHQYTQADKKTAMPTDPQRQVRSALVDKTRATVSATLALLEQQNHALTSIAAQVQHLREAKSNYAAENRPDSSLRLAT
jgi:phage terminase Nu1 subunit (DNA packaging protein)